MGLVFTRFLDVSNNFCIFVMSVIPPFCFLVFRFKSLCCYATLFSCELKFVIIIIIIITEFYSRDSLCYCCVLEK